MKFLLVAPKLRIGSRNDDDVDDDDHPERRLPRYWLAALYRESVPIQRLPSLTCLRVSARTSR